MAKIYGIFHGTRWAMGRNRRRAIKFAEKTKAEHPNDEVTVREKNDTPEISAYDMPTFWALSDQIWPTAKDTKPHLLGQFN